MLSRLLRVPLRRVFVPRPLQTTPKSLFDDPDVAISHWIAVILQVERARLGPFGHQWTDDLPIGGVPADKEDFFREARGLGVERS